MVGWIVLQDRIAKDIDGAFWSGKVPLFDTLEFVNIARHQNVDLDGIFGSGGLASCVRSRSGDGAGTQKVTSSARGAVSAAEKGSGNLRRAVGTLARGIIALIAFFVSAFGAPLDRYQILVGNQMSVGSQVGIFVISDVKGVPLGQSHVGIIDVVACQSLCAHHGEGEESKVMDIYLVQGNLMFGSTVDIADGSDTENCVIVAEIGNELVTGTCKEEFTVAELVVVGNRHGRDHDGFVTIAVVGQSLNGIALVVVKFGRRLVTKSTAPIVERFGGALAGGSSEKEKSHQGSYSGDLPKTIDR
mmetsp:Transcript_19615/g.40362  ORF Transcript_19615/g.40362 Transcript_19615/m.40362 type:complete len:302 (-) Transcript_19615:242-1147(-)